MTQIAANALAWKDARGSARNTTGESPWLACSPCWKARYEITRPGSTQNLFTVWLSSCNARTHLMTLAHERNPGGVPSPTVLMLLTNTYDPDPRVRQEALALIRMGCRVRLLAWDRDLKSPAAESMEGVEVERVFLRSKHGRGNVQLFFYAWLYWKMFWKTWRTPFDAVHCHDLDTLPLGFVAGKLKRKPIVYDAHESFTDMLHGSVHPIVLRALVRLENFLIRRIDL